MLIRLSPARWNQLGLNSSNLEYARSAFYLGYSFLTIINGIERNNEAEMQSIINAAKQLGMDDTDDIVIDERATP